MKKYLLILLLFPSWLLAQPRFENDTLTCSGGYKIYRGQTLYLANGSSEAGYFRFVKFHSNMARNDTYILQGSSVLVKDLRQFKLSGAGNHSIRITGTATRKDNSRMEVDFIFTFDKAILGDYGSAPELTVAEEFRKNIPATTAAAETKPQPATKKPAAQEEPKKQQVPDELKKLLVADEIKKLFDLYKAGALTKEEYETQKKKLLEQ